MDAAVAANHSAKAAIEMALWDIAGKVAGQPLHGLLGAPARPVPAKYGLGTPADPAAAVAHGRELGFSWFKAKAVGPAGDDLTRLEALASALQPGERFGIDPNASWTLDETLAALEPLAELGVGFLEQPVGRTPPDALARVTASTSIPVVAHESLFTVEDGLRAKADRSADVWALTPGTHGGLLPTLELAELAREAGAGCLLGSTFELGIATAFLTHVGAAVDEIALGTIPSDVTGPLFHEHGLVSPPIRIADGYAYVPAGPGLGVELDADALRHYAV
jgi:muconate cycloisomerase